ncbi:MAG TPA: cation diffusion facilitator family transporter [Kofleriaceae bacterium]|nr:cation diffusion facilitator family transporter [Kofleriaceae bacterium]
MASPESSLKAVVTALAANAFVTIIKTIAFVLSGSGAMLSEAIHSAADTGNQVLLFLGLRRGSREADDRFQYGYGGDRFIFGMLSAAGIFFVGCGVTVYHGVTGLLHPHMPELSVTTFAVLGIAFVIEGGVLLFAIVTLSRQRGELGFWRYVRERADPAAVAILLEDGVAVLGVMMAGAGITLAQVTGNARWDATASIVVGVLLGGVAIHLVITNRKLLLGHAVPAGTEELFTEICVERIMVRAVRDVKTRQLTPETYQFKAELVLDESRFAELLDQALPATSMTHGSRERADALNRLSIAAVHAVATEIQAIERAVRARIPQAHHIDLEIADPKPEADDINLDNIDGSG